MAYTASVPNAGQSLGATRDLIKENFQALEPYGNGYSIFTVQSSAPSFAANTDYIYLKALSGVNELYLHKQTTAGSSEVPFSASKMSGSVAADCDNGWSYLPSGLLIKWGKVLAPSAIIFTVDVGTLSGGPAYTRIFRTMLTAEWGGPITSSPSSVFLTGSGATLDGNFTCFVTNYDATRSYLNYLVIGI